MEDAEVAEAQELLDSLGVSPETLGLDLGQERESNARAEDSGDTRTEEQVRQEQTDEQRRQAWTRRQQGRQQNNEQISALQMQLAQQNAAIQQLLQQSQQRPGPQTQQQAQQTWDAIDPEFRKYLESTMGQELDRRFSALSEQQQRMLGPVLQNYEHQQRQQQAAYQLQQQHNAVRDVANRNIAELQQYAAQPENAGFHDRYIMYEESMGAALQRAGVPHQQVQAALTANAFGITEMAHQLNIHPGLYFDLIFEELSRRVTGNVSRKNASSEQSRANRNAAALSRPTPPGRGGRQINPAAAALESGTFTRRDAALLAKTTGGRRGNMSNVAAALAMAADEREG